MWYLDKGRARSGVDSLSLSSLCAVFSFAFHLSHSISCTCWCLFTIFFSQVQPCGRVLTRMWCRTRLLVVVEFCGVVPSQILRLFFICIPGFSFFMSSLWLPASSLSRQPFNATAQQSEKRRVQGNKSARSAALPLFYRFERRSFFLSCVSCAFLMLTLCGQRCEEVGK